jgi:uncharacterized protein (TIGR02271 family)
MSTQSSIDWSDVIKKEARGAYDDSDFGEVQEVGQNYVMTQRGIVNKDKFYIPKYLVQGYDGSTLWFNASASDMETFRRESPPAYEEYRKSYRTEEVPLDIETRIPLISERLDVKKRVLTDEVTIVKEPVAETKTIDVPVTHEELRVERRPASESYTTAESMTPVESRTEIKVPLTREEVEVAKKPEVTEEVVIKKEPVTETRRVTETVRSEKVDTTGMTEGAGSTTATRTDTQA